MESNSIPARLGYAQASGAPLLIEVATIYTNLTASVFLIADCNNSLLNVKGHLWVLAHTNLTVGSLGFIPAGTLLHTNLQTTGPWFNFTASGYFYSVRLRHVSSAAEIPELVEDIESFTANYSIYMVLAYIGTALVGGVPGMWLFGRWRMKTK